jgi:4-amino-4-deoxychorismate lyase
VFETICCVDGAPRFLERHLARLERGRGCLGLPGAPLPLLRSEIESAARVQPRALLKLVLTRGPARARGYATLGTESGTRVLLRYPWPDEPVGRAHTGVRVRLGVTRFAESPALAGLKHLNRLPQVLARREWQGEDIFESLHLAPSGALVSGTMSNVFLVVGGELLTPSSDACGVAGVMREVVLEVAEMAGIAVHLGRPGLEELARADEIFLTNVRIGVLPVGQFAERTLTAGPVTRRLQRLVLDAQ